MYCPSCEIPVTHDQGCRLPLEAGPEEFVNWIEWTKLNELNGGASWSMCPELKELFKRFWTAFASSDTTPFTGQASKHRQQSQRTILPPGLRCHRIFSDSSSDWDLGKCTPTLTRLQPNLKYRSQISNVILPISFLFRLIAFCRPEQRYSTCTWTCQSCFHVFSQPSPRTGDKVGMAHLKKPRTEHSV